MCIFVRLALAIVVGVVFVLVYCLVMFFAWCYSRECTRQAVCVDVYFRVCVCICTHFFLLFICILQCVGDFVSTAAAAFFWLLLNFSTQSAASIAIQRNALRFQAMRVSVYACKRKKAFLCVFDRNEHCEAVLVLINSFVIYCFVYAACVYSLQYSVLWPFHHMRSIVLVSLLQFHIYS